MRYHATRKLLFILSLAQRKKCPKMEGCLPNISWPGYMRQAKRRWLGWDLGLAPDLETEGSHWMHVSSRHQQWTHQSHLMLFIELRHPFHPFHLLMPQEYSPYGKLFACRSKEDDDVWFCDIQTDQLCDKPITMSDVHKIILSPALIDRSLGDQLITLCCHDTDTMTFFNVCTGHVYVQCWDPYCWRKGAEQPDLQQCKLPVKEGSKATW